MLPKVHPNLHKTSASKDCVSKLDKITKLNSIPCEFIEVYLLGSQWPSGEQVWDIITECHHCVGSTSSNDNAEGLSQYDLDLGCWMGDENPQR